MLHHAFIEMCKTYLGSVVKDFHPIDIKKCLSSQLDACNTFNTLQDSFAD